MKVVTYILAGLGAFFLVMVVVVRSQGGLFGNLDKNK